MPFICHPTQMSLASQVKSKGICFKNQILGYMVWRKTVQICFKIDKKSPQKRQKSKKQFWQFPISDLANLTTVRKLFPLAIANIIPNAAPDLF